MAEPEDNRRPIVKDGIYSLPEGLSYGSPPPLATVRLSAQLHQGPLPPPEQLAAYAQVDPDAVAWIFHQAAASADHARAMERLAVEAETKDALLRRSLPFIAVVVFTVCSAAIAIWANQWIGAGAFLATIAAVLVAYLKGSDAADVDLDQSDEPEANAPPS